MYREGLKRVFSDVSILDTFNFNIFDIFLMIYLSCLYSKTYISFLYVSFVKLAWLFCIDIAVFLNELFNAKMHFYLV